MAEVSLTSSIRKDLQALCRLSKEMNGTQSRLSTGLKVNTALDNASSYYQARSLTHRAADLSMLLDGMGQGIQTINAAMAGLDNAVALLEQMSSVVGQAGEAFAVGATASVGVSLGRDTRALYDGRGNTASIVAEIGSAGLAAKAAVEFYAPGVSADDEMFGQGCWYLPAIGELMDLYGTDTSAMTGGYGTSGSTGENKALVNAALAKLKAAGVDAEQLTNGYYWSSSEGNSSSSWELYMNNGNRSNYGKLTSRLLRSSLPAFRKLFLSL